MLERSKDFRKVPEKRWVMRVRGKSSPRLSLLLLALPRPPLLQSLLVTSYLHAFSSNTTSIVTIQRSFSDGSESHAPSVAGFQETAYPGCNSDVGAAIT